VTVHDIVAFFLLGPAGALLQSVSTGRLAFAHFVKHSSAHGATWRAGIRVSSLQALGFDALPMTA
jgi:hypothetical protein